MSLLKHLCRTTTKKSPHSFLSVHQRRFFNCTRALYRSDDHEDVPNPLTKRSQRATDISHNFATPVGTTEHAEAINVTFIEASGRRVNCTAMRGQNLLQLAMLNSVDMDGTCEGALDEMCNMCHVIIPEEWFPRMRMASTHEERQLDYLEESRWNSRMACQIMLDENCDGIVVGVGPRRTNSGTNLSIAGRPTETVTSFKLKPEHPGMRASSEKGSERR
mmetsp:Transcript_7080/g.26531  ORF Transcript_7080/g.26531 Transcript_7080/m.26531 type:complete len:219 (-) Transcript_7080:189-845(-)